MMTALFSFAASGFSQSIADAARRERDRQRQTKSKITILGSGSRTTTTATDTPTTTASSVKPVVPTDAQGRDEKYWRAAFQQAREDVKRAEQKAAVLDLRLKELNTEMLRQSDVYNRENRFGPEIVSTQKQLEAARKAEEQGKKKLSDLEDDLRKSGGLPGWAR